MPHIPKVCPVVRGWKVSQCTVKKWEPLHDSLDLASPTTESVKPSVLGAVTHEDTQNEHIPHDPWGKHPHSLENWLHRGTGLAWEWLAVCYICHSTCWVCEAVLQGVDGSECLPSSPDTAPAGAAGLEGSAGTLSLYMILFLHRKFPRAVCVQEETICSTAARHVSAWTAACPGTISGSAWREPTGTSTATAATCRATMLMWVRPLAQAPGLLCCGAVKKWVYNGYKLFMILWFYIVPVWRSTWKCLVAALHCQSFHGEWFKENKPKHCHLAFSLVQFSSGGHKGPFPWGRKGVGRLKSGDAVLWVYREGEKSNCDASGIPDLWLFHYYQILISENSIREK